jgi:hypothetical protein
MAIQYDELGNAIGEYDPATQAAPPSPTAPNSSTNLYNKRGSASSFEDTKYDIYNHQYPSDLTTDLRYGGNYVLFYINVASDSKLFQDKAVQTVDDFPARDVGDNRQMISSKAGLVGANASANVVGGAIAGGIAGGTTGAVKGAAVGTVATVGVGIAATMSPEVLRSQRRLKTAIALHIPHKLNISYGVQYSEEDTSGLMMFAKGGEEILKALSSSSKDSDVTGVAQAVITNLALSKGPNAGANSQLLGLAANPKKEQVFKGVDFRTFSFDYSFFPKNGDEAQNVLNIIKEFKYHMHPEFKDDNNFVYLYPSEFDIFYYQDGSENLNLHRHTSCVLTNMNVDYTPNGQFTTFDNGMPTHINITLAFRELALLTKDKIKDGL